jgi:heat shock protein HslJ
LIRSFILILVVGVVFLADGCKTASKQAGREAVKAHNSQNSLDWAGVYTGVVPCADCDGIETVVIIHKDRTFRVQTKYIGKSVDVFDKSGTFVWNKAGSNVELLGIPAGTMPTHYQVGENRLIQLDRNGNKIKGDLTSRYMLKKTAPATASSSIGGKVEIQMVGTKWRVVELQGQKVTKGFEHTEDSFIQLSRELKFTAYAGCNRMFGNYELKEGSRIRFNGVASTMMACPDMKTEQTLAELLRFVDNYSLNGSRMTLNKARMAPLAVFEAE